MATVEKPQPMDVDPKKVDEKVEEKTELVNTLFCRVIIQPKDDIRPIFETFELESLHNGSFQFCASSDVH